MSLHSNSTQTSLSDCKDNPPATWEYVNCGKYPGISEGDQIKCTVLCDGSYYAQHIKNVTMDYVLFYLSAYH